MKLPSEELIEKAEGAIRSCLDHVPFLKIAQIRKNAGASHIEPDIRIKLALSYGEQDLIAEVKSSGGPRLVREAAGRLLKFRYSAPPGTYGIFVAPFVSPAAAQICAEEKIGYVDFGGNCLLTFGLVYIEKKGRPNLFSEKRELRSIYSPKAERVLRVLLTKPRGLWKLQSLADEAQVSLGQVSKVKKILGDREWIETGPGRVQLVKPIELLLEWAQNYDSKRNEPVEFYTLKKVWEFEANLAEMSAKKGVTYALTGLSGAARLAPAVRYQRAMAYLDAPLEEIAPALGLKKVTSGGNVILMRPYDEGVFHGMSSVDGAWVASPVQVYLDLKGIKGRGEEAARAILEEAILPLW